MLLVLGFGLTGCGSETKVEPIATPLTQPDAEPKPAEPLRDEVPSSEAAVVARLTIEGLGRMERYEYAQAAVAFREAHQRAPGWIAGSINLAIAMLNDTGVKAEAERAKKGAANVQVDFGGPLDLLSAVLDRDPDNLAAHYCSGLIQQDLGETAAANKHYKFVIDHDPTDAQAWLRYGSTLASAADPDRPASLKEAKTLIGIYEKALEQNPYLVGAIYRLQQAYSWDGRRDIQKQLLQKIQRLDSERTPVGPGDSAENFYGEAGKYALIINPFTPPKPPTPSGNTVSVPKFAPSKPIAVKLADGESWVKADDFQGPLAVIGRARARFGATVVSFDADGDGKLDLFLGAAVKGPKGVRDVLLLNQGGGTFADASRAWGLPDDTPSLSASAADFDADRRVDLVLTRLDGYRLLRNEPNSLFKDVAHELGLDQFKLLGIAAHWIDLDQDGDLDLFVVNHTDLEHAAEAFNGTEVPKVKNAAFRNLGSPAAIPHTVIDNWVPLAVAEKGVDAKVGLSLKFDPWPDSEPLTGPPANYTGAVPLFLDNDRDLDLIVAADKEPLRAILNDRLALFHQAPMTGLPETVETNGLVSMDINKDGRPDLLVIPPGGKAAAFLNETNPNRFDSPITWSPFPIDAKGWRGAQSVDLDLDTWPDLIGLPAESSMPAVDWSRNDRERFVNAPLATGPAAGSVQGLTGFIVADLDGDPLNDLLGVVNGEAPFLAPSLADGRFWIALDLGGRWKTNFDHMRTNPHGIGTRIRIEGENLLVTYDHFPTRSGTGGSIGPIVLGLATSASPELIRLKWPDGTMQCEMTEKAGTKVSLSERNRKTGSCPVLFTWNGERFVCMGDFLGGGGMGYLVAPGVYGQPDRDESMAITAEQLKVVRGTYRMSITEPMDELAYLDKLELVVVDRPPGVSSTPDERFAPEGPRPTGEPIAWKTTVEPKQAADLKGNDITKTLQAWDRDTADRFDKRLGWIGYAEDHGIVLDFGDRLKGFGPADKLTLVMAGWVEYPYSQTNYAASTAGVTLETPKVERLQPDGTWAVIEPHAGYPAGLPRMTTLDLTGKLLGDSCLIRIRTNMECYYDQAFLAVRDPEAERQLETTTLQVARAALGHRGYTREVSPDGKQPLLYDYDYVDPAPLALMAGQLTKLGDVVELLNNDDDRLCLVGPGDELRFEFDAKNVPPLKEGWTRSYVLKTIGYCKDADPLTATGDRIDPLPWRGMPNFPFADPSTKRPQDAAYKAYLDKYQTRPAGGRD